MHLAHPMVLLGPATTRSENYWCTIKFKPVADGENIWCINIFLHLLCNIHGLKFIKLFEPANDTIENYLLCILHTNQVKKSNCPSLMIVRVSMIKTKYKKQCK